MPGRGAAAEAEAGVGLRPAVAPPGAGCLPLLPEAPAVALAPQVNPKTGRVTRLWSIGGQSRQSMPRSDSGTSWPSPAAAFSSPPSARAAVGPEG